MPIIPRLQAYLRRSWRSHLTTVLMALGAMLAVNAWQTRHAPSGAAPEFSLPLLLGHGMTLPATLPGSLPVSQGALSLAQWRVAHPGKPVVIHIWSDWCPFCKAEESSITHLSSSWPVLTVASRSGGAAQVGKYLTQRRLPWAVVVDPQGDVAKSYGLAAVPALVVLDAEGHIRSISTGYTTWLGMQVRLWWAWWF